MIAYVFDASSIVNLVKRGTAKPFSAGVTLELALYESLNAVWKEYMLLKRLDEGTALEFVEIVKEVFNAMMTLPIRGLEVEVFKLASKEGLTVYDASYLYVAMKNNLTLVTDDQMLKEKATRHVRVLGTDMLM